MVAGDSPPGLWRGSKQSARDAARRRKLLDAALELYGTAGYRATTVQHLCREAGVSSRSFYELYPHHEALLVELYQELNAEVLAGFAEAEVAAASDLQGSVRLLVAGALGPMLCDGRKARVLEIESVGVSEDLEQHRRAAYRTFAHGIDKAFGAFVDASLARPAPAELTSLILVGGITEALVQRLQTPHAQRADVEEFLDQIAAVIVRLISSVPIP